MTREYVLILVLVEHTLGGSFIELIAFIKGLNPCFSGTYSRSAGQFLAPFGIVSLNPCFSGTYSRSSKREAKVCHYFGLNPCFSGTYSRR